MLRRLKWKLKDIRFNRRMAKQRYKKGYADCDVWGMNYWLGETFAKMIRRLEQMKHGCPMTDFKEVNNFPIDWVEKQKMEIDIQNEKDGYECFDLFSDFSRWQLILRRIAWCLEQTNDEITDIENEYYEEYNRQSWGEEPEKESFKEWWNRHFVVEETDKKGNPKLWRMVERKADEELERKYFDREKEISQYRDDCKNEAFDLLKEYFWALWD